MRRHLASLGLLAALAGCTHDWDSITPPPDVAVVDAARELDAGGDLGAVDVATMDAPDADDVTDAHDAADVTDAHDAHDATDVVDARDAADVVDVQVETVDASDERDVPIDPCLASGLRQCGTTCVDLEGDPMNCGACGRVCPTPANSVAVCSNGTCESRCVSGDISCGGACVDPTSAPHHCGDCTTDCAALAHVASSVRCQFARCQLANACADGFDDCNAVTADGCETSLATAANCGACGTTCGAGQTCAARGTGYACACMPGYSQCGAACSDLRTDVNNCGACNNVCANPANASRRCEASACASTCNPGFARVSTLLDCGAFGGAAVAAATSTCATNPLNGFCGCTPGFGTSPVYSLSTALTAMSTPADGQTLTLCGVTGLNSTSEWGGSFIRGSGTSGRCIIGNPYLSSACMCPAAFPTQQLLSVREATNDVATLVLCTRATSTATPIYLGAFEEFVPPYRRQDDRTSSCFSPNLATGLCTCAGAAHSVTFRAVAPGSVPGGGTSGYNDVARAPTNITICVR